MSEDLDKSAEIEQVSDQEVWDVIEFAKQMFHMNPTLFDPSTVNSRMKDVTMNPLVAEEAEVTKALGDPKNNEDRLRGFSEFFEYTNMVYKRTLHYLGNLLAFDLVPVCTNASGSDYTSKQYQKDEQIMHEFLDKFTYKYEFNKIVRQLLRQDAYFGVFRDDGEKFIFQELPINYCKITGQSEYGYLFDFDMSWFLRHGGTDIDLYPPVFKEYMERIQNSIKTSRKIDDRTGSFSYWVQTSPEDGLWCFKMNQEQVGLVPYFAPLFPDLIMSPMIRNLQRSKYIVEASRILVGLVPMLKEAKSGNVKDMFALSPEAMGKFANLFRQGLSKEIQMAIGPFEKVESVDFHTTDYNMLEAYNKNTSSQSGVSSRVLFMTDKANALETQASIDIDEMLVDYLYPQFNHFIEFFVNKKTKKYKFKFAFEGTKFSSSRARRQKEIQAFAGIGIVLPDKIAASLGIAPQDLSRMMEKAKTTGFDKNCMLLLNAYTQTADSTGGRPQKDSSELSDAGNASREAGSNIEKGGSV